MTLRDIAHGAETTPAGATTDPTLPGLLGRIKKRTSGNGARPQCAQEGDANSTDESVHLHADELEALRDLRAGQSNLAVTDPVWQALAAAGLVEFKGRVFRYWSLTTHGRAYKTD